MKRTGLRILLTVICSLIIMAVLALMGLELASSYLELVWEDSLSDWEQSQTADPKPTEPEPTDPEPTEPEPTEPEPTEPEPTDPEPTEPEPTEPEPTEPEPTEPEPTEPESTEPKPTEPEPTEPEPTDPEPTDPPVKLRLNRVDITFRFGGGSWQLYTGGLDMNQIVWSTDDGSVAVFADGMVTAVGPGVTRVYAEYGEQKVSCLIRCMLEDD